MLPDGTRRWQFVLIPDDCYRPVADFIIYVLDLNCSDFFVEVDNNYNHSVPIRRHVGTPAPHRPAPSTYHSNWSRSLCSSHVSRARKWSFYSADLRVKVAVPALASVRSALKSTSLPLDPTPRSVPVLGQETHSPLSTLPAAALSQTSAQRKRLRKKRLSFKAAVLESAPAHVPEIIELYSNVPLSAPGYGISSRVIGPYPLSRVYSRMLSRAQPGAQSNHRARPEAQLCFISANPVQPSFVYWVTCWSRPALLRLLCHLLVPSSPPSSTESPAGPVQPSFVSCVSQLCSSRAPPVPAPPEHPTVSAPPKLTPESFLAWKHLIVPKKKKKLGGGEGYMSLAVGAGPSAEAKAARHGSQSCLLCRGSLNCLFRHGPPNSLIHPWGRPYLSTVPALHQPPGHPPPRWNCYGTGRTFQEGGILLGVYLVLSKFSLFSVGMFSLISWLSSFSPMYD